MPNTVWPQGLIGSALGAVSRALFNERQRKRVGKTRTERELHLLS